MELFLGAFIKSMAEKHEIVFSIIMVMGMARLVLKPLMVFLHEIVLISPTDKDNKALSKLEDSKIYKGLLFVLDYLFSLKVKKK